MVGQPGRHPGPIPCEIDHHAPHTLQFEQPLANSFANAASSLGHKEFINGPATIRHREDHTNDPESGGRSPSSVSALFKSQGVEIGVFDFDAEANGLRCQGTDVVPPFPAHRALNLVANYFVAVSG